ncbi:MAG: putative zinc-binding metallopeptidase [bacterium]
MNGIFFPRGVTPWFRMLGVLAWLGSTQVGFAELTSLLKKTSVTNETAIAEATPEMIELEYLRVAKKCGFAIAYTMPDQISGDVLTPNEAKEVLPQFFAAMDIFPVRFLQETRLNTVVLCRNLRMNGQLAGGVATSTGVIVLNVPIHSHVIYHEMFHIADKQRNNPEWTKLNSKQFVYGGSIFNANAEDMNRSDKRKMLAAKKDTDIRKDFVSDYATTSEMEDRAETFAVMVTDPRQFEKLASTAPVLKRKAEKVKSIVREFSPGMSKDFWTFIANSNDESRMKDLVNRAALNAQRIKEKKSVIRSGYTK